MAVTVSTVDDTVFTREFAFRQFDCKEYEHVPVQNHDQDISHINIVFVTRHRRTNCDSVAESVPDRPPDHPRTIFVSYRMIHTSNRLECTKEAYYRGI